MSFLRKILTKRRKELGHSLRFVGSETGVSYSNLCNFENGKHSLETESLERLITFYRLKVVPIDPNWETLFREGNLFVIFPTGEIDKVVLFKKIRGNVYVWLSKNNKNRYLIGQDCNFEFNV